MISLKKFFKNEFFENRLNFVKKIFSIFSDFLKNYKKL